MSMTVMTILEMLLGLNLTAIFPIVFVENYH